MSPPTIEDELKLPNSSLRKLLLSIIEVEIESRFPRLSVLLQPYATTAYVNDRLSLYVKKQELNRYVTQDAMIREVDIRTRVIAEERVYALFGTQTGLFSLLERQKRDLQTSADEIMETHKKQLVEESKRVINESLESKDGSLLTESISRKAYKHSMQFFALGCVASSLSFYLYNNFIKG